MGRPWQRSIRLDTPAAGSTWGTHASDECASSLTGRRSTTESTAASTQAAQRARSLAGAAQCGQLSPPHVPCFHAQHRFQHATRIQNDSRAAHMLGLQTLPRSKHSRCRAPQSGAAQMQPPRAATTGTGGPRLSGGVLQRCWYGVQLTGTVCRASITRQIAGSTAARCWYGVWQTGWIAHAGRIGGLRSLMQPVPCDVLERDQVHLSAHHTQGQPGAELTTPGPAAHLPNDAWPSCS